MKINIQRAETKHIEGISILFDLYRQFYQFESDLKKSKKYISERLINNESIIFISLVDNHIAGFVQLYETFDSLNLNKKLILYDLFVEKKYRKNSLGRKLMNKSKEFAIENNLQRIELSTAINNVNAQSLYESLDYIKDTDYYNYELEIRLLDNENS